MTALEYFKNSSPNYKRDETILILPNNTLRFVDAMYELELMKINKMKIPKIEDFDTVIFKSVNRKVKDLHYKYKFGEDIEKKFKDNYYYYYDIAPRTKFYEYLNIINHQKFTNNTYILFDDKRASDPAFENIYYDGSLDGLEKVITDYEITALVFDDIDLIKTLIDRGNISLDNMTLFTSKVGYNYTFDKTLNRIMPKSTFFEVELKSVLEMAIISLFDFDQGTFDKINKENEEFRRKQKNAN